MPNIAVAANSLNYYIYNYYTNSIAALVINNSLN